MSIVHAKNQGKLQSSVVVKENLTSEDLRDLFEDRICVLHVKNFASEEVCHRLDSFLRDHAKDLYFHEAHLEGDHDLVEKDLYRYGFPLICTYNADDQKMEEYFAAALPAMQAIREAASPFLSPVDKLRVELDELWDGKTNLATLAGGRKALCGMGRLLLPSEKGLLDGQPHFDSLRLSDFPEMRKHFTANVYLSVPEDGGKLEVWDVPPIDLADQAFVAPKDWRAVLPESIKVKPEPGDLVILNGRRPHGVTGFASGSPRTSIQAFIGMTAQSDLFLWT